MPLNNSSCCQLTNSVVGTLGKGVYEVHGFRTPVPSGEAGCSSSSHSWLQQSTLSTSSKDKPHPTARPHAGRARCLFNVLPLSSCEVGNIVRNKMIPVLYVGKRKLRKASKTQEACLGGLTGSPACPKPSERSSPSPGALVSGMESEELSIAL